MKILTYVSREEAKKARMEQLRKVAREKELKRIDEVVKQKMIDETS